MSWPAMRSRNSADGNNSFDTEMNKPIKRYDTVTEHYLVPAALIALNVCAVHLIYAYSVGHHGVGQLIALSLVAVLLTVGLISKERYVLIIAISGYLALLLMILVIYPAGT